MPLITKLLFFIVGWGLSIFVILAFMRGATARPAPHYRIEPIGRRRYSKLWVVDRDESVDNPSER